MYLIKFFCVKVEQNLENLVEVCNGTAANQTLCVTELAKNIKNGVSLGMENSKLQEGKDLLKKLVMLKKLLFNHAFLV